MRLALFATFILGTAALAQTHNPTGSYGNILHPGVPSSGALRAPSPTPRPNNIARPGNGGRRSYGGNTVYVPYPIYGYGYGFGFDNFNQAPYAPEPPAPPEPPTPAIILNQNFQTDTVRPQFRDYSNTPLPEPGTVRLPPSAQADDQPTIFLIALRDRTILPVIAYWVDGDTLNYVTVETAVNHVSLSEVDRDFSKKLNADRNVPFALPR